MIHSVDWTLWGFLLIAATLEIVGDLAFEWWAETDRWLGLVIGLIVYSLALILFVVLLRRAELALLCGWGLLLYCWPLLAGGSLTKPCRSDTWRGLRLWSEG